jgi:hypothetical protein
MNKKKVLITNHKDEECGVYQYGKRFASVLIDSVSDDYEYFYLEVSNKNEFIENINKILPDIVIHNYLDITMPWFDSECFYLLKNRNVPQGLIVHNIGYSNAFDFFLHQHPFYPENGINHPIPRPLFKYESSERQSRDIPKINTFGFAFSIKKYESIVQLVNDSFEEAEINMHLTISKFFPNHGELEKIKNDCFSKITKSGIKLNISSDFKSNNEILDFLDDADLNIFLYQNYNNYNGISSVIDYALSVKRPIAICKSNMFAHLHNINPSICIEDLELKEIIKNGVQPIEHLYLLWGQEKFTESIEKIINIYTRA